MSSFDLDRFDELVVVGALRQFGGEQCCGELARRWCLTRREQRDQAAGAVHKLKVGDEVAQLFKVVARQQLLALDHDEHVEFGRGEAFDFQFVLPVFLGIGTEQLAQGIVDLDALDSENRADEEPDENNAGPDRSLDCDETDPFEPKGNACQRTLLDLLDVNFTLVVLFEHALSNSHNGPIAAESDKNKSCMKLLHRLAEHCHDR